MSYFYGEAFLETALKLAEGSEADKRSAVSRAYYAAFLVVKEFVRSRSAKDVHDDGRDHSAVPHYLQRLKHFQEAYSLLKLKRYRHQCDYERQVADLNAKVMASIRDAEKLLNKYKHIVKVKQT